MRSSLKPPHPGHAVDRGTQSATHSQTFPTMSEAPQFEVQLERLPVLAGPGEFVTQVVEPSSALPGSGVPAAAPCHSALVSRRLSERRQACCDWNQVMQALGRTPATETAYTPGVGGISWEDQLPSAGKLGGNGSSLNGAKAQPSCVAPAATRSPSVAVPFLIRVTSCLLLAIGSGTLQTLASYLSTQVVPTGTESGGQVSAPA